MAMFWDTSLDEYIPPKPIAESSDEEEEDRVYMKITRDTPTPESELPQKKAKTQEASSSASVVPESHGVHHRQRPSHAPDTRPGVNSTVHTRPPYRPPINGYDNLPDPPKRVPPGTYKGRRIGSGSGMPDAYRVDTVRAFLEPIAWCFGMSVSSHRRGPILQFKTLLFPLRLTSAVWQPPGDREHAKQGWLQGPAMGVSCRSETGFNSGNADPVLDVLREVGAMLVIAEERHREARQEVKPGAGQWWATTPRWGGGPGGALEEAVALADEPATEGQPAPVVDGDAGRSPNVLRKSSRRRMSAADAWKQLRPGAGFWDARCEYMAIGKLKSSPYDEVCISHVNHDTANYLTVTKQVFLLSSLNSHVAVLKLRIHAAYTEYLISGSLPEQSPDLDPDWSSPVIYRTKWLDLLDTTQRVEAARGLWGVMNYIARAESDGAN